MSERGEPQRDLKRLAGELGAAEVAVRQAAARVLLEAARGGGVLGAFEAQLAAAAEDEDPVVRRWARVALVVWGLERAWGMEDAQLVLSHALDLDEQRGGTDGAESIASTWRGWAQPGRLMKRLVPLDVLAIETGDAEVVRAGLLALRGTADLGCALTEAIAPLACILANESPGAAQSLALDILARLANRGHDIAGAARALTGLLDADDENLAWRAAKALGRPLADAGDGESVTSLLTHSRVGVRQGIAEALFLAAIASVDMQFAVSALNAAALDGSGGVSYYALRALGEAALRGTDVTAARDALEAWSTRHSYSTEGWFPYLYHEDASDLGRQSPAMEARNALRMGVKDPSD